jgi:hypothetical protein
MTNAKTSTHYTQRNTNDQTKKSKTIQIDPSMVGLVIGKGGTTIISLAKEAGKGCRIQHDQANRGTFTITAWKMDVILRAEIKVKQLVDNSKKESKTKMKKVRNLNHSSNSSNSNAFASLDSVESEPLDERFSRFSRPSSSNEKLELNFSVAGTIRERKTEKWLAHHASDEEKIAFRSRQSQKGLIRQSLEGVEFPELVKPSKVIVNSKWGALSEEVKTEKVKSAPVEVEKDPSPEPEILVDTMREKTFSKLEQVELIEEDREDWEMEKSWDREDSWVDDENREEWDRLNAQWEDEEDHTVIFGA